MKKNKISGVFVFKKFLQSLVFEISGSKNSRFSRWVNFFHRSTVIALPKNICVSKAGQQTTVAVS